jgi:EmrB/QacA subfamily drug resistance transporter
MPSTLLERAPARLSRSRPQGAPNQALVLAIILATYLMIILDATIVITALPKIHRALGFSPTSLSWVQNAYTLTFGGLLLLGARAGDILGRRRVFVVGIALFTVASLLGGLAQSQAWLLIARAAQGIGAAIAAPSTLALLQTSFPEGPGRTRAVAAYSAVAGGGGSVGLVVGGMLTSWVSWRWGLFINVPIGAALIWLAPRYLPETERRPGHFDLCGAITSTLGMAALVYGFVRAASAGWTNPFTMASFVASALLLSAFLRTEIRAEQPITPLRLFASRERSGAYVVRMLLVSGMFAMFFFLTQFFQGVLGYSPIKAGLAFLPVTLVMFGAVRLVPRVAERVGGFRLLVAGVLVAMIGMAWLSRLTADSAYFPGISIPMVLLGVGIGTALTPLTSAGISGVAPADAGAASGLVNVAQQLGSSLGLGILVTVFASMSHVAMHERAASTLARGIGASLTGSAIFLALALTVVILAMRPSSATRPAVTGAPADGGQAPHSRGILGSRRTVRVAPVVAPDFVESYAGAEDARRCS